MPNGKADEPKRRKKRKIKTENFGANLTCLDNAKSKAFLERHHRKVRIMCSKLSKIPWIALEDLVQECEIKMLSGYHEFQSSRAKESTWVNTVVRNTMFGVWSHALKEKRACHLPGADGKSIPVYNFSLESTQTIDGEQGVSLQEVYSGSPDGRPVFATPQDFPDESSFLLNILETLRDRLSEDAYQYIKDALYPSKALNDIMQLEEKFRTELSREGFKRVRPKKEYEIWTRLTDVPLDELNILCQIADVLVGELGFSKKDILSRELMIDANL